MFDFPTNPASGTVVMVPDGSYRVWDSTKWRASPSSSTITTGPFLPIAGGVMSGALSLFGNATSALHAVPLQQLTAATAGGPFLPLSGGSVSGPTIFTGATNADRAFLFAHHSVNNVATPAGQLASWYGFNIDNDSADATTAQGAGAYGAYVGHNISTGAKGGRTGFSVLLNQAGATTTTAGQYYVALGAFAQSSAHAGASGSQGTLFGANIGATVGPGSGNWIGCAGFEIDVGVTAGNTVAYKSGLSIVQFANDAVQGITSDVAIQITNQSGGTAPGWKNGICFGGPTGWWPFEATNSVLIGTQAGSGGGPPMQAYSGIDFSAIAFVAYAFNTVGLQITNSGHVHTDRGIDFGNHVAASVSDFTYHINLYNGQVGINITSADSNTNYGSFAAHNFVNASGTTMALINASGITSAGQAQIGGASGPTWTTGSGVPSSTQPVGSLYSRVSTWAAGATLYVSKGSGAWTAVASV